MRKIKHINGSLHVLTPVSAYIKFLTGLCTGVFNFRGNASDCNCISFPFWLPSLPCVLSWLYVSIILLTIINWIWSNSSFPILRFTNVKFIQKDDICVVFPFRVVSVSIYLHSIGKPQKWVQNKENAFRVLRGEKKEIVNPTRPSKCDDRIFAAAQFSLWLQFGTKQDAS